MSTSFVRALLNSTTGRLFRDLLAAQADDIDVLIHELCRNIGRCNLVDLGSIPGLAEAFLNNAQGIYRRWSTGRRALVLRVGRLFYRRDPRKIRARVPETWEELAMARRTVQDGERAAAQRILGYVFQGQASDELTYTIEWFASWSRARRRGHRRHGRR